MKMSNNYKKLCLILGITTALGAGVVNAANYTRTLQATYKDIKVTLNGVNQNVPEPFIVDSTTYVPLRAVSDVLGAGVLWDQATNTIKITQSTTDATEVERLKQELNTANYNLAVAQHELTKLKEQIEAGGSGSDSNSGSDLSDSALQKTLDIIQDEYGSENHIDWTFGLTKSSSGKLELEISYDSRTDGSRFDRMSSNTLKYFVEDVCDEIRSYHSDIEIVGAIADSRSNWEQANFTFSKTNRLSFSLMSDNFFETERNLDRYYTKFEDIQYNSATQNAEFTVDIENIKLSVDSYCLMFTVNVNLTDDERNKWDDINYRDYAVEDTLLDIKADIEDEYDNVDVEGQVVDKRTGDVIASIDANGRFNF